MIEIVDGIKVCFPEKLKSRRDEVIKFALELSSESHREYVKVWENKRHDLMGKVVNER